MRENISAKQLLRILNLQLSAAGVPESCQFSEPICRLPRPDSTGCNWSHFVTLSAGGHSPLGYLAVAEGTLLAVSRQYNLEG